MKKLTTLILIPLIAATIFSCTKTSVQGPSSIQGKWSLKLDSIAQGVNGPSTEYSTNYKGTGADYFDFRSNNKLYVKEGAYLDTFTYKLNGDNSIYISSTNPAENGITNSLNGIINSINSNSATIHFAPATISFGLYYSRTVNLKK